MARKRMKATDRLAIRRATRKSKYVSYTLACAIASRESDCQNIIGDAGHGRGMFQLDDRFQQPFLRSHRGCKPRTSIPIYSNALAKGRVPTVYAGATEMCRIVDANVRQAIKDGVPWGHRLKLAVSAYNTGYGSALSGFRKHGDSDNTTTGHDYARDVMNRQKSF